ncbi:MAG: sortase [Patescibacteria group bacterium]|nr:sortase [Patescibacteria group bacterium]
MDGDQNTRDKNTGFRPWEFLLVFLVVFFLFATILFGVDFVPEAPKNAANIDTTGNVTTSFASSDVVNGSGTRQALAATTGRAQPIVSSSVSSSGASMEVPVRIEAPSVGIDTPVENPSSIDNTVLNNFLLKGAVRYPESGLLGENARVYIFAHQSYLPIVHNKAFKAFNGIQNLKAGDEIIVSSETGQYHYRVKTVEHVNADDAQIELGSGERTLILSTCDVFGKKTDRYVVTADFVSANPAS